MPIPTLSRRKFIHQASVATAAAIAFPYVMRAQGGQSPNNKLNMVCVGVGGRGRNAVGAALKENVIAFCDVDDTRAAKTYEENPTIERFRDYRRMFDKLGNQIDAVTVSTPDHMHYPIALAALSLGKHVFVEKPLSHTIWESRQLAKAAREKKVATQMGNQGRAWEGARLLREWFQAGVLGTVREVVSWTDRPIWPQNVGVPDHSQVKPVIPSTLDWELWLGVAELREYDPCYLPFNWRGYWDFGTGALGDMGCHLMSGAYWALDLTPPTSIEAAGGPQTEVSPPSSAMITYEFPARRGLPPVKWTWYDGGLQPPAPEALEAGRILLKRGGTAIIGSKSTVIADENYQGVRIIPETKMRELAPKLPPKTIPRIPGGDHFAEWINACKGGTPAGSSFDFASSLTETVLLGNVALRAGRRIVWDSAKLQVTNFPSANHYVTKQYRPGFGV